MVPGDGAGCGGDQLEKSTKDLSNTPRGWNRFMLTTSDRFIVNMMFMHDQTCCAQ
jgi:hypothetical protein